jgi:hypothetical protein
MRSIRTSVRERARRLRVTGGRVRVTKPGRKLNAAERAEVVKQMRAEGRLGREVR